MAEKPKKEMEKKLPSTTNKKTPPRIIKKAEFDTYVYWYLIPLYIRRATPKSKRKKLAEEFGLSGDDALELCQIPTQSEFAKKYEVNRSTLTEWNQKIMQTDMYETSRAFYQKLVHKVDEALTEGATRQSKTSSSDRKLFYQRMHGFAEKTDNKHEVSGIADMLKERQNKKKKNVRPSSTKKPKRGGY